MDQSLGFEIKHHFSAFSRHGETHALFEPFDGESMGQDLVNVDEVLFQQGMHGVPS